MKKDANFKSVVKDMLAMCLISSDMIRIPEYDATDLRLVFCVTCLRRGRAACDGHGAERVSVVVSEEVLEVGHRHLCRRQGFAV